MILPIYTLGQNVLKQEAEEITFDYPNLQELIANMYETMEHAGGIGLAAPQVGLPIRLVVIDLDALSEDMPEYKDFKKVFINGYIEEYGTEEDVCDEGCLSIPGIYEPVKRPTSIRVSYQDENGNEYDEWINGYLARVIQHEFDHLDGTLFVERIGSLRKKMIKSKLSKMQKGDFNASYKTKALK